LRSGRYLLQQTYFAGILRIHSESSGRPLEEEETFFFFFEEILSSIFLVASPRVRKQLGQIDVFARHAHVEGSLLLRYAAPQQCAQHFANLNAGEMHHPGGRSSGRSHSPHGAENQKNVDQSATQAAPWQPGKVSAFGGHLIGIFGIAAPRQFCPSST
jgi:hypothetical protein